MKNIFTAWLFKLLCKHQSRTTIFEDHQQDRYIVEKCNCCGKEIVSSL